MRRKFHGAFPISGTVKKEPSPFKLPCNRWLTTTAFFMY